MDFCPHLLEIHLPGPNSISSGADIQPVNGLGPELQKAYQAATLADRKPIQNIENQKSKLEDKLKLLNDLIGRVDGVKGLLPQLNSPIAIRELTVGSSDERALSATADKSFAQPGSYSMEVRQLASPASALSNGLPDRDKTRIGSGYFSYTGGDGESHEVFIDDENATLDGVARSINGARLGIRAGVVNDMTDPENPWRLVITGEVGGAQNSVNYPEFYFVDGQSEFFIEKEKPATNALIRFQGQDIESPTNEIKDLMPGVTVNLKGVTEEGRPGNLTISQDIPKTTVKMKDLVDKLNGVFSFVQSQNNLDEKSDTSRTLGGDYSLRVTEDRLRTALTQNYSFDPNRSIHSLGDRGVQFDKKGTLTFDEKKFQAVLNANFDGVVDFMTGDGVGSGVVPAIQRAVDTISSSPGSVLTSKKQSDTQKVTRMQKDIEDREKLAARKQEDLKLKLSHAQAAITTIQQQGASLGQMGGGGNILNQLLGG